MFKIGDKVKCIDYPSQSHEVSVIGLTGVVKRVPDAHIFYLVHFYGLNDTLYMEEKELVLVSSNLERYNAFMRTMKGRHPNMGPKTRLLAWRNHKQDSIYKEEVYEEEVDYPHNLMWAFNWKDTMQGHSFWARVNAGAVAP